MMRYRPEQVMDLVGVDLEGDRTLHESLEVCGPARSITWHPEACQLRGDGLAESLAESGKDIVARVEVEIERSLCDPRFVRDIGHRRVDPAPLEHADGRIKDLGSPRRRSSVPGSM